MDSKIRVGVRIRPLNSKELEASSPSVIGSDSGKYVVTKPPAKKNCFEYDWSFDLNSTNRMVYDMSCRPLIENIFDGFNCTFFAYGQTSSGKTHTLGGADMSEGVIPFALQDIFERRRDLHALGTKVDIELSYIEIYREECFDLLSKEGTRVKLDLKETSGGKTVLDGVTSQPVADIDSVMTLLRDGAKVRSTGQTAMNAHSSRSHSICTLNVRVVRATTGTVVSQLHLVDLAGSERAKKTQATGDAFQEGISINRGLLALGNVVSALASKTARPSTTAPDSHIHVPYRESKLTRLLKDALGGNGMTVMLACVSPADANFEETLNTLRFASRASSIVNSARVNHSVGEHTDTVSLLKEISDLRNQLTLLQAIQGRGDANKAGTVVRLEPSHRDNRDNRDTLAERESLDRVNEAYYFMVTSALRVTSSLKIVLLTCLQEGSYVVDGDLLNIQADLAQIRKGLNLPRADTNTTTTTTTTTKKIKSEPTNTNTTTTNTTTTDENSNNTNMPTEIADLDMESMLALPPIMTLIEEVRLLEKDLRAVEKTTKSLCNGARRVSSTFKRESLSDHSWADDSMLSGGDMSVSILQSSDDPNMDNLSFEQSFVSDGGFNPMESFAMDCSFNAMDALNIEQEIAQFMQAEGSMGASSGMNSTGGVQGFVKQAKMSFAEEEEARQASKGLLAKEAEVSRIAALTDKYQNSIRALRSEIQAIENDQEKLQNKQKKPLLPSTSTGSTSTTSHTTNKPSSGTSVAEEMRIKQQLREKTKLLEEKMKLLRTKESEFGKISSQKARLVGEVEGMKKVVEDHKRKRADLQRKMREEQTVHRAETTQIKHSEIQARRRELQAQQSVLRLEGQMQTKERVWKAQLESKERESKQLKELVGKQQTVRNMQAAVGKGSSSLPPTASTIAAAGALLSSQGSSGLTTKEALDLKLWVDNELESQCKRMQTQESLSKEMLARTQVARQLQAARAAAAAPPTDGDAPPTAASMKTLENEIRARSSTIASLNGVLTDLGNASVVDKKRFSRFTDLKQARLVSEVLFDLASKTQRREQSATKRMRAMQEQLLKCRKQLQDANNSVVFYQEQAARRAEGEGYIFDDEESESAEMDETFYPTDESDADASDHSDSDDSFRGNKKSKFTGAAATKKAVVSKSAKRKSDSSDSSMSLNDSDLMAPPSKKPRGKGASAGNNRTKRVITSDNEDAESDAHSGPDNHDNQSDASDSESDTELKKKPVKRKAVKKSVSTDSTTVTDGAVPVVAAPKRAKRVHTVDPDFDDSEITFPLSKYTINELKRFLGCKGLTVSGVKAELIERLEKALGTRAAQVNDENVDNENVSENVAVFELGDDVELEQVVVEI